MTKSKANQKYTKKNLNKKFTNVTESIIKHKPINLQKLVKWSNNKSIQLKRINYINWAIKVSNTKKITIQLFIYKYLLLCI